MIKVVVTDYPDKDLVENLRFNVANCCSQQQQQQQQPPATIVVEVRLLSMTALCGKISID